MNTGFKGTLPRKIASNDPQDMRGVFSALSDLQDAVRFMPEVEFKDFDYVAHLSTAPIRMTSRVKSPAFITANAWVADNPSVTVIPGGVHWFRGQNGDLVVTRIGGLTLNTKYRVRLRVEGERK